MTRYDNILKILGVIAIAGCVQLLLILLSQATYRDLPGDAVIEYSKAYYRLDPEGMGRRMCAARLDDDGMLAIDDYRHHMAEEARARGLGLSNLTYLAYHLATETERISDTEAKVRLTGKRRVSINPVYPLIAVLFGIGQVHPIDEIVPVIKEGDQWKVCSSLPLVS